MTDASEFGHGAVQTEVTATECRSEALKGDLQTWSIRADEAFAAAEDEVEAEDED